MLSVSKTWLRIYFGVVLVAMVLSGLAFSALNLQLNQRTLNLLTMPGISVHEIRSSGLQTQFNSAPPVKLTCETTTIRNSECGISFHLPFDKVSHRYPSLMAYSTVAVEAGVHSTNPAYDNRVRVSVRVPYSDRHDANVSPELPLLKFQSLIFNHDEAQVARLDSFQTDMWWINANRIPHKDTRMDFSQVFALDILVNDLPLHPGTYQLVVNKIEFSGQYVTTTMLFAWMGVLWPLLIIGCFAHLTWLVLQTKSSLLRDSETGFQNLQAFALDYQRGRNSGIQQGVHLIKVNNYTQLIKVIGHDGTHQIITQMWQKMKKSMGNNRSKVYRLSSTVYALKMNREKFTNEEIQRILNSRASDNVIINDGEFSLSVDLAYIPSGFIPPTFEELRHRGEHVLQLLTEPGTRYAEFTLTQYQHYEYDHHIAQAIVEALETDQFYLVFMPFYASDTEQIIGAEALLRCSSGLLSTLSPEVYIRVAEQNGLIKRIDMWVIERCFKILRDNAKAMSNFTLSINISARQMMDFSFIDTLKELTETYQIKTRQICFELTETFFVNVKDIQSHNIEALKTLGFKVSLDDFGTGYTSFAYLMNIPADEIKIDRSYVNRLGTPEADVVVSSIINIARTFNYELVAEGVENQNQLKQLRAMGCNTFQGYHICKPTTLESVLALRESAEERKRWSQAKCLSSVN